MRNLLFVLGLILLGLCGCSEKSSNNGPTTPNVAKHYLSTADLPGILEHGKLRLLAPRFDGADALPRSGIPVMNYQAIAEELAIELGLEVQWVYVAGFDELIPALLEGRGDIIITNMSSTKARQAVVKFTNSIARVKEVVVTRKADAIASLDQLQKLAFSVPRGTSYLESLEALGNKELVVEVLPTDVSDSDLLEGLVAGEYQATVLDDDILKALLPGHPDLVRGPVVNKKRKIAWAVRTDNPALLDYVNKFLVSHHVKASSNKKEKRDWRKIQEVGRLRMLTTNNPASYFIYRGELMGFDYDLLKKFADQHELHLSVILKDSIPEMIQALNSGEGDVIAASITVDEARVKSGLLFSAPYLQVQEQVVGRAGGPSASAIADLAERSLGINPETVFGRRLLANADGKSPLNLVEFPQKTTEELLAMLEEGVFDFTVADSHLVAIEHTYHQNIVVNFDLTESADIAWAARPDQKQLIEQLNAFIAKQYKGLFYNVTFNKYFKNDKKILELQEGRVESGKGVSPYDALVKLQAEKYGMDWRLIVAQMYQESKFNPNAKSFAGARGLMQVLPRTAKQFGFTDLKDPEQGIQAGVAYLDWLDDRFPQNLDVDERIYFTLAAYNAGTGHVRDAMTLARRLGYDPHKWFGHVEKAMLKLSQPQYYKNSRFGYVRGSEPVEYVKTIRDRYLGYLNAGVF